MSFFLDNLYFFGRISKYVFFFEVHNTEVKKHLLFDGRITHGDAFEAQMVPQMTPKRSPKRQF